MKSFMMRMKSLSAIVVLLALSTAVSAQTSGRRTVVRAGKLLDVKTGKLETDQAIVIEGDKIVSLGPVSAVKSSSADIAIDLPNATVLPGLIDAHTHLTFNPHFGYETLAISTPREALIGAHNARLTLEAGFTTVRNVGATGYADVALRDAINAGDVPGPRMLVSGPPLGITGGHCDNDLLPYEYHATEAGVADGVEQVQHKVREVIKYGADLIKVCATGGVLSKGDDPNASQYTLEEMKAIVADAHRLGRKVAAHAHGAQGVIWASEAGVDSVEHGHLMNDAAIATLIPRRAPPRQGNRPPHRPRIADQGRRDAWARRRDRRGHGGARRLARGGVRHHHAGSVPETVKEHLEVVRYVPPAEFAELRERALALGFRHVESGPLVRSSYHAWEHVN